MYKLFNTTLLLTLTALTSTYASETWVNAAHEYADIEGKHHRWDTQALGEAPQIKLHDVLLALPHPDKWSELEATYNASLPQHGTSKEEALLTRLMLAYLNNDLTAAEALLIDFETQVGSIEDWYSDTSELRSQLFAVQQDTHPEKALHQFKLQLKSNQPINEAEIAEILGGPEILEQIKAYTAAQQEIMLTYMKLFESGMPEGGEAEIFALQERATKLPTAHAEAVAAMEAHEDNPLVQKYFENGINPMQDIYLPSIQVPDLITLTDEAQATELLLQALQAKVDLSIDNADATLRLAQKLALENIDTLAAPQWGLAQSIDQVALYEAMNAKFPTKVENNYNYQRKNATGYYFWGLVAADRATEAMELIRSIPDLQDSLPWDAVRSLKKAGYTNETWNFLDQLLATYPEVELWDDYMALSAELNKNEAMLARVKAAIENKDSDHAAVIEKHQILASAYLASDDIEQAVLRLLEALKVEADSSEAKQAQYEVATKLIEVGHLINNSAWVKEGFAEAKVDGLDFQTEYGSINASPYRDLIRLKITTGDRAGAIDLADALIQRLESSGEALVAKQAKKTKEEDYYRGNDYKTIEAFRADNKREYQDALIMKMGLLVSNKDYTAALKLLDESTLWLTHDAIELLARGDASPENRRFGWLLAKTLQHSGKTDAAAMTLEALLKQDNGYDPAYALYLEIKGADALGFFDKLFALDQFQERPLIWKAQHLVNEGDLSAAEAIAKQAIAIDPSDGEQPRNDRMRVYDVMRQIRAAQGNNKEAKFFADVVKAIRHSENADQFYSAGLYLQAIKRYKESLTFFADAYCVQSRLAVRLYDEGRVDEAAIHYKKAYELMPSSFGRVESHCFGCESVFSGEKPQSIADEVFSNLLITQPEVPQVHYLIGYLRDHQEREVEAMKHFQDAVALDPDYLNAWEKIASLSERMHMTAAEKDKLILKIYSLDPMQNHSSADLGEVSDLKAVWTAVLKNQELVDLIPTPKSVYPFKAAAKLPVTTAQSGFDYMMENVIKHPADALKQNQVIESIEALFIDLGNLEI
ncbi:MAG: hypothetical protein ACSHX4_08970 [Opitutaceae bacterium]